MKQKEKTKTFTATQFRAIRGNSRYFRAFMQRFNKLDRQEQERFNTSMMRGKTTSMPWRD